MMEIWFWGALLRMVQAVVQASPTLLAGLFVAGVLRRFVGPENTRRLFGDGTWHSMPQSWAIGMLLPVCSLGVLPVIHELRRSGVTGGAILAFALAAPLFNPLSMLYGLTLSHPQAIFAFVFGSLTVVTVVGVVFDRTFGAPTWQEASPRPIAYGWRRLLAILVAAAREAAGPSLAFVCIGLLGVALLAVALPHGSLQSSMEHDNLLAPLIMAAVAIPAYATPMTVMGQLGSMFQHGNSIGAAFVLLTLGAGMNLGILVWIVRHFAVRRAVVWGLLLLLTVIGIAYALERPLYPRHIEAADHTHAFDIFCLPFTVGSGNLPATVWNQLRENLLPHEVAGLMAWGGVLLLGAGLRILDRWWKIEDWLERKGPEADYSDRPWHERPIPAPVLGLTALAGLVAFSIVGCFAYYPPPGEVFEELRIVRTEAIHASNLVQQEQALRWIELWQDWTRRLEVGVYLREGKLTVPQRVAAARMRDALEELKHEVEEEDREEIQQQVRATNLAYQQLRTAFLESP